jgi:hypothetical protein
MYGALCTLNSGPADSTSTIDDLHSFETDCSSYSARHRIHGKQKNHRYPHCTLVATPPEQVNTVLRLITSDQISTKCHHQVLEYM